MNLETLGSPKLILLEGEGPVLMEDYHDRTFRDLVVRAAETAGAPLRRGMRARNSTDAVIPSRAGIVTGPLRPASARFLAGGSAVPAGPE